MKVVRRRFVTVSRGRRHPLPPPPPPLGLDAYAYVGRTARQEVDHPRILLVDRSTQHRALQRKVNCPSGSDACSLIHALGESRDDVRNLARLPYAQGRRRSRAISSTVRVLGLR